MSIFSPGKLVSAGRWLKVIAVSASLGVACAHAQQFPSKPLRIIVPFTAGGSTDILARLLAKELEPKLGQSVVVENRPGGSTVIGGLVVAKAPADGHTLLLGSDITYAINPHVMKRPAYDPHKELTPVSLLTTAPNWLVVQQSSPIKDFPAFVAAAKDPRGKLTVSVNAPGGYAHLVLSAWVKRNNLSMTVIPYPGAAKAVPDLLGGHLDAMVDVVGGTIAHVREGRMRGLTLLQTKASDAMDKVPPYSTDVARDLDVRTAFVLFTTGGTSPDVVARLYAAVNQVMQQPDVKARLVDLAMEPVAMNPAQTSAYVRSEFVRFGKVIAEAGLPATE